MRLFARLFALCLSLFSLPTPAVQVDGLYQVREAVTSQQPEERTAALGRALETLMLRLTGDTKALQGQRLAGLRQDPQQLVSQYVYEGDNLVVDFDPLTTENKLRQAGVPTWGANRPLLMVWWLNSNVTGSNLVGDGQEAATPLRRAAQHRGLPLRLPLADLQEQLVATPENLAAGQVDILRSASEPYAADALLTVSAHEQDGQWQADWRLWLGDAREQGNAQAADQSALTDAVLLAVSQRLAPRFLIKPGAAGIMTLEVQGADLPRYAELARLLDPFAARLLRVSGDLLVWQVNASAEQLRAQLGLAGLREVPTAAVLDSASGQQVASVAVPANLIRFSW